MLRSQPPARALAIVLALAAGCCFDSTTEGRDGGMANAGTDRGANPPACALSRFEPQVAYATGLTPEAVAVSDFDGDGRLDLAVVNSAAPSESPDMPSTPGTTGILLGRGDGTFAPQVAYPVGTSPAGLVVADFNGDAKPDLAVTNGADGTVSILRGRGDGTFAPQVVVPVGTSPAGLAVADFDGDGRLDLAVANSDDGTVGVLLGHGDGTFARQIAYPAGTNPQAVAAGDFDGDGKPDLAVANSAEATVSILLGRGDGTFAAQIAYPVGARPMALADGDFDGDGTLDLAVANFDDGTVSVLPGRGDGTFGPQTVNGVASAQPSPQIAQPDSIAVADFNGDGKPDLAVADWSGMSAATVDVLANQGRGRFGAQVTLPVGYAATSVAAGDFNGDGRPDLAVTNYDDGTVSILLNDCTP